MRSWTVRSLLLAIALVFATAIPSAAQTVGIGVSFLGDEGGTGVTLDYSKVFRTLTGDRTLGWVGDFSFHHNGFGSDFVGVEGGINTLTFQGGIRINGVLGEKVTWHAQGLVGIMHSRFTVDAAGLTAEVCDAFDIDCSVGDSDTGVVVTPGAGIDYAFNERAGLRAQLDIPIGEGGATTRFWFGLSFKTGQ